MDRDFINKVTDIILENISDEKFGVSELASATGMSRSNLLRRIQKLTGISASRFISRVRLEKAKELLLGSSLNVSEVSYEVGFSSTSYFIKCFRDHYGYPPGETAARTDREGAARKAGEGDIVAGETAARNVPDRDEVPGAPVSADSPNRNIKLTLIAGASIIVIAAILFILFKPFDLRRNELEKSIAVLPFINDSDDPSNVYIVNGLMESVLNNLQKIGDLRVVSRTSVEKYRDHPKTIREIADELNVSYIVEGSGQKVGDRIMLNIQLIEAPADKHLWAEQYSREIKDIFGLQAEVAGDIANRIEAIITPEEEERINKVPTDNLVAYDHFLKGLDHFHKGTWEGLEESIRWFEKAIEHDPEFARAYADIAIAYYFMDAMMAEKQHLDKINTYADQALLFDPQLPQSLIAKATYYMNNNEYLNAVPYLEKALEYNPNSALVLNTLSDFYTRYLPDTRKYLEYALKGIRLDIASHDSTTASFIFLHVSNALIQNGFVEEALRYIERSLEFDPSNLYSETVRAFILYARDRDLQQTKELLISAFARDTTRLDILQEVGKICYYMRDYPISYAYYRPYWEVTEAEGLDIYLSEKSKIGYVFSEMGFREESDRLFKEYRIYAENDKSVYRNMSLAVYYSFHGNASRALEYMELFASQPNFFYWVLIFLPIDPILDNIRDLPEYRRIFSEMEENFWKNHEQIKDMLEAENLL